MTDDLGEPSPSLDMAFVLLDHAIESLEASRGPLAPLLIVDTDGDWRLVRFVSETLEEGLAQARAEAAGAGDAATAIAFDGYTTIDDTKYDAVHVEVNDGADNVSRLAQRYEFKGLLRKRVVRLGNPILFE